MTKPAASAEPMTTETTPELRPAAVLEAEADAQTVTIEYVMARLHIRRTKVFELLRSGKLLRAEKLGRETIITKDSVIEVERRMQRRPIREAASPQRARRQGPLSAAALRPRE